MSKAISSGVVHKMPADLRQALVYDQKALTVWEDITPLARNEWICWTISVKRPETREDHVRRVREELIKSANVARVAGLVVSIVINKFGTNVVVFTFW